jgi:hypothetical protein
MSKAGAGENFNGDGGQAVIEIVAERSLPDHGPQVAIGGGDHADIDAHFARAADAAERGGIEHTEKLGLGGGADFANLVEKDRAAVGHFEETGLGAVGAGEGAALVTEQFALQKALL